ncbi:MAG TPA: NAD(+)/NADH kinase, partial [Clostridia bacterium]|nr:NAD(+)/NADH kinase [Clostridia bacterium]
LKKQAEQFKTVGLIGNSEKVSCGGAVNQAAKLIAATGRKLCADEVTARLGCIEARLFPDSSSVAKAADLVLVFGGDGTMLRIAREIAGNLTPILGVNIGSLGFLTAVPSGELEQALNQVWSGQYSYESRVLLQAVGHTAGRAVAATALNDIVVTRSVATRLIELEVRVNGEPLTRYRCDGLIISSATGSTAYALAAGGAIIAPTAEVVEITPICPHTLSNRSLIIPLSATIEVTVISPKPATILSADGQVVTDLHAGDTIRVRRSRRTVRLMHLAGSSFFETLRRKLHWRGATI